jgi:hypothetical protein
VSGRDTDFETVPWLHVPGLLWCRMQLRGSRRTAARVRSSPNPSWSM